MIAKTEIILILLFLCEKRPFISIYYNIIKFKYNKKTLYINFGLLGHFSFHVTPEAGLISRNIYKELLGEPLGEYHRIETIKILNI